jgi:hypothetical protein
MTEQDIAASTLPNQLSISATIETEELLGVLEEALNLEQIVALVGRIEHEKCDWEYTLAITETFLSEIIVGCTHSELFAEMGNEAWDYRENDKPAELGTLRSLMQKVEELRTAVLEWNIPEEITSGQFWRDNKTGYVYEIADANARDQNSARAVVCKHMETQQVTIFPLSAFGEQLTVEHGEATRPRFERKD